PFLPPTFPGNGVRDEPRNGLPGRSTGGKNVHTQTAPEGSGVVGILMLGVDMATERALLQRLRALAGTPPERIAPTDDLARCAVLVAHEDSPMARAARHMVADRPGLRFWTLGADGTLRDGRDGRAPLDGAAIRA